MGVLETTSQCKHSWSNGISCSLIFCRIAATCFSCGKGAANQVAGWFARLESAGQRLFSLSAAHCSSMVSWASCSGEGIINTES